MRRIVALFLVIALVVALTAPAAHAGGSVAANVALGLASFAVFNQLVGAIFAPRVVYAGYPAPVVVQRPVYREVIYTTPAAVVTAPPSYQPAPTPSPSVVHYPHGRYELRGDGVNVLYQWVWIPNPPPPPPPPAAQTQ
jgi:hypothetical protein